MTKYLTTLTLLSLLYGTTAAQGIENSINLHGENFPAEKIHIHFDKERYLPGETIWFKAYVFEENLPSQISTNFYISLYDEQGKLLQQKIYPIINATADGYFDIGDSVKASQLVCRAFTGWMLNFDTSFVFTKAIRLFTNADTMSKQSLTVSLRFFPEGGDIIEGERNTIAFKASYNNELPFDMNGVIKKQQTGEVITAVKAVHDGMGKFDLEQEPGEKYYVEWTDHTGKLQQTYLPEKKTAGVLLKLTQVKSKLYYNVVNKMATDTLHVLGYMYQKIIYKANLPLPLGERYSGIIPLDSFPTGAMQLTVFNAAWQPLAERICFVNNGKYALQPTVTGKETSVQKRGKNIIEITMPDTLPANLSLSVTDADFDEEPSASNIFSNLLLSGDVRGYIHQPAYYFTSNTDATLKEQLDLVMLTHGWRRYNWNDMLAGKMPVINTAPDDYLSIYGQIGNEALGRIKKEETVTLIVKTKDSTSNYYFAKPDAKGLLKTTGLVFYDTARVYYSFNTEKKYNRQLAFSANNYILAQPVNINNYSSYLIKDSAGTGIKPATQAYRYYTAEKNSRAFNKEKTLQAITVKNGGWNNWKNNPLAKMDEKYTTGLFRGGATAWAFDVMHDERAEAKFDIFNYLSGKVPGLAVNYASALQKSFIANLPLSGPVTILVDEIIQDPSYLNSIPINDIAYIKVLEHYYGTRTDAGFPTAISIYLKKGADLIDRTPKDVDMGIVKVPGYSPVKEFYSPDYTQKNNATGTDARTTLLWQPYIFTGKNNMKVPVTFYNNDFSKRIKIVVEGINEDGKLIHVEKIIE